MIMYSRVIYSLDCIISMITSALSFPRPRLVQRRQDVRHIGTMYAVTGAPPLLASFYAGTILSFYPGVFYPWLPFPDGGV